MGWHRRITGWAAGATVALVTSSAVAQAPPAQGGCLGYSLDACLAALRTSLVVDEHFMADSVARQRHRVDVNGRPLGTGLISVSAKLPGRVEQLMLLVHFAPDDRVTAIESTLLSDPVLARTEGEYDRTGLYPIVQRLVGHRCPEMMTPLNLYRFFENNVKPTIQRDQQNVRGGILGGHRRTEISQPLGFCGARFTYGGQVQWSGPLDLNFGRNITAVYTIKLE